MNLLKSISIYTVSNISRQAVGFVLIPIITTYLTVAENGDLTTLMAMVTMIGPFIYFSAHSAINVEFFRSDFGKENFNSYVSSSLINPILATLLLTLLFALFGDLLVDWLEMEKKWIMLVPALCFVNVIPYFASTLYQANKKPIHHSVYNIGLTVVDLLLSILLIIGFSMSWEGRAIGMLSSKLFFTFIGFYLIYRSGFFSKKINREYTMNAFYFGLPLIPHIISAGVMDFSDQLFIRKMVSKDELGIYGIGYKVGSIILFLQASLMMAWIPFLFEKLKNITDRNKTYIVSVSYLIMIGLVIAGLVIAYIGAPIIYRWFIGSEYADGLKYVPWIATAYVFLGFYKMFSSYIIYMKRNSILSYLAVFNIITNLFLNYFLIKAYGTMGAAYATVISYFLFFVITAFISNRLFPLPWFQFKEIKQFMELKWKSKDFLD